MVAELGDGGLIVLGTGAVLLGNASDRRDLVDAAAADRPQALTNNRYSADAIAVAQARRALANVPDLPTDNALPRWLEEHAGVPVDDRRGRTDLGIDIDGPLDLVLLGGRWRSWLHGADTARVRAILDAIGPSSRTPRPSWS